MDILKKSKRKIGVGDSKVEEISDVSSKYSDATDQIEVNTQNSLQATLPKLKLTGDVVKDKELLRQREEYLFKIEEEHKDLRAKLRKDQKTVVQEGVRIISSASSEGASHLAKSKRYLDNVLKPLADKDIESLAADLSKDS